VPYWIIWPRLPAAVINPRGVSHEQFIAAAGELATALEIVPWRAGEARDATALALWQWIDGRGGTEPAEVRQAIEQVRLFIEQHGESRFDP
jgi:putative DNA primase/helicase